MLLRSRAKHGATVTQAQSDALRIPCFTNASP